MNATAASPLEFPDVLHHCRWYSAEYDDDDDAARLISDTKLLSDKRMTLLASDQAHGGSLMPINLSGSG